MLVELSSGPSKKLVQVDPQQISGLRLKPFQQALRSGAIARQSVSAQQHVEPAGTISCQALHSSMFEPAGASSFAHHLKPPIRTEQGQIRIPSQLGPVSIAELQAAYVAKSA